MTDREIEDVYQIVKDYHEKYLNKHGVKLPKMKNADGTYVKDALVLVYLARFYPSTVSVMKGELTEFIRKFYPKINDVQQARHLGAQKRMVYFSRRQGQCSCKEKRRVSFDYSGRT